MKKVATTVAVIAISFGAAVVAAAPRAITHSAPHSALFVLQNQSNPGRADQNQPTPTLETFTGTIKKTGDKFVLTDESTKSSYELDDQQSASKFDGKKVKVVGTLDVASNMIRVQSIEVSAA